MNMFDEANVGELNNVAANIITKKYMEAETATRIKLDAGEIDSAEFGVILMGYSNEADDDLEAIGILTMKRKQLRDREIFAAASLIEKVNIIAKKLELA